MGSTLKFYLKIEEEIQNNLEKVRTYPIHSPKKFDTLSHHHHHCPCRCYGKFLSYTQNLIVFVLKIISYLFTISLLLFPQFRVLFFFLFFPKIIKWCCYHWCPKFYLILRLKFVIVGCLVACHYYVNISHLFCLVAKLRTCGPDVNVEMAWKTDCGNNKLRLCVCL